MAELSEAAETYLRMKAAFGGRTSSYRQRMAARAAAKDPEPLTEERLPYGPGRDPVAMESLMTSIFRDFSWQKPLAQARVLDAWSALVGDATARHATPRHIDRGVLVVQCDSTAWATQLRSIRTTLLATITQKEPDAEIEDLRFLNPGAPSWKHGPRSVPGRGPRDTYG